ncbi:MAG: hypothetical protein KDD92_20445 [Caldilineaceae bacterium]|nr:hypothetical protein [Caldilineaceae bacterium]
MSARILYFCPDFPQPSGGVKALYRHVSLLAGAGFDAAIVHQKRDFVARWHGYTVPVIRLEDRPRFGPEDTLVFPEVMADFVRQTGQFGGRRVVIALSWALSYSRLRPGERWADLGVDAILARSPAVQHFLAWSQEADVTLIPPFIDPARYYPQAKANQVAYMTRKDPAGPWLQAVLTRRNTGAGHSWLALRNMDEATYAQHLRRSAVYLPVTLQEGLHASVLEAMACGCLTVGYSGIGGSNFMIGEGPEQNCVLVENGDLLALGRTLEEVLARRAADPQAYAAVMANGQKTVQPYQDPALEKEALIQFFNGKI